MRSERKRRLPLTEREKVGENIFRLHLNIRTSCKEYAAGGKKRDGRVTNKQARVEKALQKSSGLATLYRRGAPPTGDGNGGFHGPHNRVREVTLEAAK